MKLSITSTSQPLLTLTGILRKGNDHIIFSGSGEVVLGSTITISDGEALFTGSQIFGKNHELDDSGFMVGELLLYTGTATESTPYPGVPTYLYLDSDDNIYVKLFNNEINLSIESGNYLAFRFIV